MGTAAGVLIASVATIPEGTAADAEPEPGRACGTSWGDGERFLTILCASWLCSARRTGGGPIAWRALAGWKTATGPTTARAARTKHVDLEKGMADV